MHIDRKTLITASEELLSSVAVGRSWAADLEAMARAAGSHSAVVLRSKYNRMSFVGTPTFDEGASYLNRPGDPPYDERIHRLRPAHEDFAHSATPTVAARLARTPLYQDVMLKIHFSHYAGLPLPSDDGAILRFVFWRSGREGAFSDEETRLLDEAAGNIRFAALFARRTGDLMARQRAASFLERGDPVFALDERGRVSALNAVADIPIPGAPFSIHGGRLVARSDRETRLVGRVVLEGVSSPGRPGSVVSTSEGGFRHQLLVMPLHGEARDLFCATKAIATSVRLDDGAVATIGGTAARFLATGFDLTEREIMVALLGAEGLAPTAIALGLGIGEGTTRNYMKSIFRKTGVRSQSQLAALVAKYR